MHIIMMVIGVFAGISFWMMHLRRASHGAREALDLAKTAANLPRRLSFLRKSGRGGLDLVDNPIDAATIIMVAVADAAADDNRDAIVLQRLQSALGLSATDAAEALVNGRWLIREIEGPVVVSKMTRLLRSAPGVGPTELADLHTAIHEIAGSDLASNTLVDTFRGQLN